MDHLKYALELGDGPRKAGFDDITLVHNCLPGLAWDAVSLATTVAGLPLAHPVMINAITGGSDDVAVMNKQLADLAALTGAAMAVGSQFSALENKAVWESYQIVRRIHRDGILIANLGAHATVDDARIAVDMIGADALQIHLNAAQEIMMAEGDRDFRNYLENIAAIAANINVPVIVKEVGCGIAKEASAKLATTGIACIDVGGAGGTNFVAIEAARSCQAINTEMLSWGIPTAASAFEVATSLPENIDLIISGGIRTPLDCVKGLTIGAKAAAIAAPALRLLTDHETVEQAAEEFHRMLLQIRRYMMLVGASQVGELPSVPIVISGFTREWLIARGIDTTKYAQR